MGIGVGKILVDQHIARIAQQQELGGLLENRIAAQRCGRIPETGMDIAAPDQLPQFRFHIPVVIADALGEGCGRDIDHIAARGPRNGVDHIAEQ